jgi:hypothetical protein
VGPVKTGLLLVPVALALLAASSSPGSAASCRAPADADPHVAPDGSYVLFRRITRGCAPGASVWLSDLAGHNLRQLVGPATSIGRVSWRRDGLVSVTVRSQTLLLSPRGLVARRLQVADPFWAPDAVQAAYAADGEIFLWPGDVMLPGRDNRIGSSDSWASRSDRIAYVDSRAAVPEATPSTSSIRTEPGCAGSRRDPRAAASASSSQRSTAMDRSG